MSELSAVERCRGNVALLLPLLAETTSHRQYIQHHTHMETTMKQVREGGGIIIIISIIIIIIIIFLFFF